MTRRGSSPGFSLPEIMVAFALFGLAAVALSSLQFATMQTESKNLAGYVSDSNAVTMSTILKRYAAAANYIQIPSTGTQPTQQLLLWQNIDPSTLATISSDPSVPVLGAYFCVDGGGKMFLYTTSAFPMPDAVTTLDNCGTPQANINPVLLGGGSGGKVTVQAQFSRPAALNVLDVAYSASYQPSSAFSVSTSSGSFETTIVAAAR